MEKISEMIKRMCPEGVEKVKLGEICNCITGGDTPNDCIKGQSKPTKEHPYPVYANGDDTYGYASHYRIDKPSVTISSIGNVGTAYYREAYFTPIIRLKTFIPKNRNLVVKFLYYCLSGMTFIGTNSSLSSMKAADFKKREIPLPPLSIQQEIVRILDSFTSLITNLETELASRQKQYEYYRNKLLTFDDNDESVEWKTLGIISENCDKYRKPIASSKRVSGIYPYYGASGIVDYVEGYIFDGDYLLISEDGANLIARSTPIAFSISGKNWVNNHAHVIKFEHRETRRLVEIYLNSIDLSPWITGGAQPKLNQEKLNTIPLPIPPFEHQREIVSTLDTFESLIQNIKRELEARKKQYEYYREQLLTFE